MRLHEIGVGCGSDDQAEDREPAGQKPAPSAGADVKRSGDKEEGDQPEQLGQGEVKALDQVSRLQRMMASSSRIAKAARAMSQLERSFSTRVSLLPPLNWPLSGPGPLLRSDSRAS